MPTRALPRRVVSRRPKKAHVVVALWVVAVVGGVLLILGPRYLWGLGGQSAAGSYIDNVDRLEQQMSQPLSRLLTAYRGFSRLTGTPGERVRLDAAERTLHRFEQRLVALPAPREATKLRLLLIQLVRDEDRVAAEIDELAVFAPRFRNLLAVAALANTHLARTLAAATPPKPHKVYGTAKQIEAARTAYAAAARRVELEQADAVEGYDAALAVTLRALAALQPPPVLEPAYASEVRMLRATIGAGAALAHGLRKTNTTRVPELGRRFTEASRLSGDLAAQRSEIAAVEAYNARVHAIENAQTRIQSELARLQRGG
jgi:hypothetical protein